MMKYSMKDFKIIADTLLSDITADSELKQKVVSKCKKPIRFQHKIFLIPAASFVVLVLFFSNQFFKNNLDGPKVSSSKTATIISQDNIEEKDNKTEVTNEPEITQPPKPEANVPSIQKDSSTEASTSVPIINSQPNDEIKIVQGSVTIINSQPSNPETNIPNMNKDPSVKEGDSDKQDGVDSMYAKTSTSAGNSVGISEAPMLKAALLPGESPSTYKEGTLNEAKALIGEDFSLPTYLVDGITLSKITVPSDLSNKVLIVVVKYNWENKKLTLTAQKSKTIEPDKDYKKVDINGMVGYLTVISLTATNGATTKTTSLTWNYKGIQYEFNGDISEDELIKMAGSIK